MNTSFLFPIIAKLNCFKDLSTHLFERLSESDKKKERAGRELGNGREREILYTPVHSTRCLRQWDWARPKPKAIRISHTGTQVLELSPVDSEVH